MLQSQDFQLAFLFLTLALAARAQSSSGTPTMVTVKRGQTLSLSLLTPIDSAHTKPGDDVTLKLERPLVSEGAIVLPTDWTVHGTVTKVKQASKNCHDGEVAWKLDLVTTPEGDQLKLQEVYSYPYHSFIVPGDPVWVPLTTPWTKIRDAAKIVALVPVIVALSPLMIPMAISMGHCGGEAGKEKSLPIGFRDLRAVSKSARVRATP